MRDFIFDISFKNVDFDIFLSDRLPFPKSFSSKLSVNDDEIILELKIPSTPSNYRYKLFSWISSIITNDFGNHIEALNFEEEDLIGIDFSNTSYLKAIQNYDLDIVIIHIDTVSISYKTEDINYKAFVVLNENGFNLVNEFYSLLMFKEDKFVYEKKNSNKFIGHQCEFYPHFSFRYTTKRKSNKDEIIKIPQLNFEFEKSETIDSARKKINSILITSSFYLHQKIRIKECTIHLNNRRTHIINTLVKDYPTKVSNLRSFGYRKRLDEFFLINWSEAYLKYEKLEKVINIFIESLYPIGGATKFLMRFNILETCMENKSGKQEEFEFTEDLEIIYNRVENILLSKLLNEKEIPIFKEKRNSILNKIKVKPIKSPIQEFLLNKNIPVNEMPISLSKLKRVRDKLTHGSVSLYENDLYQHNVLMYRLSGVLIMDLIGLKEWKLNLKLPE